MNSHRCTWIGISGEGQEIQTIKCTSLPFFPEPQQTTHEASRNIRPQRPQFQRRPLRTRHRKTGHGVLRNSPPKTVGYNPRVAPVIHVNSFNAFQILCLTPPAIPYALRYSHPSRYFACHAYIRRLLTGVIDILITTLAAYYHRAKCNTMKISSVTN